MKEENTQRKEKLEQMREKLKRFDKDSEQLKIDLRNNK